MQSRLSLLFRSLRVCLRLSLGLLLLIGLGVVVAGVRLHAHAAPAATLSVTDCSGETGPGRIGTVLGLASAGDKITFSCSGTIPISSTLTISTTNLTLDGRDQSVTLDGGTSTQVLSVNGDVTFTLQALTITNGSAGLSGEGGGLFNKSGMVNISNSTFSGNSAASQGGGLFNESGTVNINNSTFSGNSAPHVSGGGLGNVGTVTISNSTFANNSAFEGGGLINRGTVTISNSTFANNSGDEVGGGLINGATVNISRSIVANNPGGDCLNFATITDQGYNVSSDSSCGLTDTSSLQNTDPKLGPLASNGGPTQTMALLKGSPAIDAIPLSSSLYPRTDQRGHKRPDNPHESAWDIGAYES